MSVASGVHPSYVIHVRRYILEEVDGPMWRLGVQGRRGIGFWWRQRLRQRIKLIEWLIGAKNVAHTFANSGEFLASKVG